MDQFKLNLINIYINNNNIYVGILQQILRCNNTREIMKTTYNLYNQFPQKHQSK